MLIEQQNSFDTDTNRKKFINKKHKIVDSIFDQKYGSRFEKMK